MMRIVDDQFIDAYKQHEDQERLEKLYREIDVLTLLDMAKDRLCKKEKTKAESKAIDRLFHALVEYCEWNPEA